MLTFKDEAFHKARRTGGGEGVLKGADLDPIRSLKNSLPISSASKLIYKFDYGRGSSYVGRTEK